MKKINYWAVLIAVLITFIASAIWYTVFSHQYFELRGIDPNDAAATAMAPWQFLVLIMRHVIVTFVVAYLLVRLGIRTLKGGLGIGLLLWVGFPLVLLVGSAASDKVPLELVAIHGGDWLIKLLIIGAILAVWHKKEKKGTA